MFNISSHKTVKEFEEAYNTYLLNISAQDIFYHSIRLINNKSKIVNRDIYDEYYKNILNDIDLETMPLDCFLAPDTFEEETDDTPDFVINRNAKEYIRISKRVTAEDIINTFPITSEIYCKVKDTPDMLPTIIDDIFIHFCTYKYLEQIEKIRLENFSVTTPIIEYVVDNITLDDLRKHNISNMIKPDKCQKYLGNGVFFKPEYVIMKKFYMEPHENIHGFNIDTIINLLTSNIVLKSDIYIIIGIYMTLLFASTDIRNESYDEKCTTYVKDVISKL